MKTLIQTLGRQALAASLALTAASSAGAAPINLSGLGYVTYGDANSYDLQVTGVITGATGPGSPYYVDSSPGAIKDLIVVATGAGGTPVNTNFPGMDDALSTPSGVAGSNYFAGVWNSTLAAFSAYLNGANPLFFFNNNQTNSGAGTNQDIAVWAQISLTGAGQKTLYFDFTNRNSAYAIPTDGGGGVFLGDVAAYTSSGTGPIAGTNAATDYVLSGGAICLSATKVVVSCSSPAAVQTVNNNLGANQAAYAIDAPELDAFLAAWAQGQLQAYTDLHIDLRMGCDPATGAAGSVNCIGRDANSGYEQLFIGTSLGQQVPEPAILALLGLGGLGVALTRRRKN